MQKLLLFVSRPYNIVILTVLFSFIAWAIPEGIYWKGYDKRADLTIQAFLLLCNWYFSIIAFSYIGYHIGGKIKVKTASSHSIKIDKTLPFYVISFIAFIGVFSSIYSVVSKMGIEGIVLSMLEFSLNSIDEALYEGYSAGINSLRYTIIIAFGISIYKLYRKEHKYLSVFNIISFISYTIIFGKRLQILCGLFIFITLFVSDSKLGKKLNPTKITLSLVVFFVLIVAASTLRGFNTFTELGFTNPISATLANAILYLAAPMQGFVTIANNIDFSSNSFDFFLKGTISTSLNTNSAFSFIVMSIKAGTFGSDRTYLPYHGYGLIGGFIYIWVVSFFYSLILGILWKNSGTYFSCAYGIVLYAFAEIWRIDMFSTGMFYILFFISLLVPLSIYLLKKIRI